MALEPRYRAQLMAKLSPVTLAKGTVLYRENEPIKFVYFIETGMVSMVVDLAEGQRAEVGITGREGLVGISLAMGVTSCFAENMVQIKGSAWRMSAKDFGRELKANTAFCMTLLRSYEGLTAQIMQTAACNGQHDIEQRIARWFLMAHDRLDGDVIPLTQELIAMMLGVHRPSITVAATMLQKAGAIRYSNGQITVLDRLSLEARACECYRAVQLRCEMIMAAP